MKKYFSFYSVLAVALMMLLKGAISARAAEADAAEQAAVSKTAQGFIEAFHKGDAKAVADFWALDGDYVDLDGRVFKGRKAIAENFAEFFKENKGLTLRIEVHAVRFPTPDTAIEDGVTSVMSPDGGVPSRVKYTNMMVKKDGKWLLTGVRETAYVPPNNYEQLRPLEWAIGEWVQDTKEAQVGRVAFDWSPDQNFIVAVRAVGVKDFLLDNGSQRIGWDPAAKMIRSWNFEADGGFGEGSWVKDGENKWLVSTSSVLRSGSLMTATTLVTRVDADTITWQSKNITLDGKSMPDLPVIKMKRVK